MNLLLHSAGVLRTYIYIFTKERSAFLTGGEIKIVKWLKSSTQTRLVKQRCITP